MIQTEKASTLRFGGIYSNGYHESEIFVPNERNASAEALICLNCTLPANQCKPNVCKRYKEEIKKLRRDKV